MRRRECRLLAQSGHDDGFRCCLLSGIKGTFGNGTAPSANDPFRTKHRRLAPATGDSVVGLDLNWPARVAEVAPHFVAHSSTNFLR